MTRAGLAILAGSWTAAAGLALTLVAAPAPRLIYNPSLSAPRGFYAVAPAGRLTVGDVVLSRLPADAATLAARRAYVPAGVPVLKRLAAGPGARICRAGADLTANGRWLARAKPRDHAGRPLPVWRGCRTLGRGEVLLLSGHPASFDGRYFGPTQVALIVGKVRPLWTW